MIRRRRISLIALVSVLGLIACATTLTVRKMQLSQQLRFSHKKHVEEADCGDCHEGIEESTGPTRGQFIGKGEHGGCAECHEDEVADKEECAYCHIGTDQQIELTRVDRHLIFSHAAHAERTKEKGCAQCHAAEAAAQPGLKLVPNMDNCANACHERELAQLECDMCHRDLLTRGLDPVAQIGHGAGFFKQHGLMARNPDRCVMCHDQTHCADCHARTAPMVASVRFPEKVQRRFIHRNDFLSRHAIEARNNPATCWKCHGASQCSSCHELQGIASATADGATTGARGNKVHGPEFMVPGSPGFHGREARRNISTCASCHDAGSASNCVSCHRVGAYGGNPHPSNFTWRKKRSDCRNNEMCAACHANGIGCR